MTTNIKTTKRKTWHRPEDRWEWNGVYIKLASKEKPSWIDDCGEGFWLGYSCRDGGGIYRTTESQRRNSLRRIVG